MTTPKISKKDLAMVTQACFDCGEHYGSIRKDWIGGVREGECGICHKVKVVTADRDFGYFIKTLGKNILKYNKSTIV